MTFDSTRELAARPIARQVRRLYRTVAGRGRRLPLLLSLVLFLPFFTQNVGSPASAAGQSYYVDCSGGNDNDNGTSPSRAWKSMSRANNAVLLPGDSLLFKRGCTWNSRLNADWDGTASNPILIGAYGSGALPLIQNGSNQNVKVTGSYQIMEYLQVRSDPPSVDPNCNNQPVGWSIGFNFVGGASHNILRHSKASEHTAGVRLNSSAHHNQILYNTLTDNYVLQILDPDPNSSDLGAWGIIVNGDDNEIAYNYLSGNNAWCAYDFVYTGNSVELYGAKRTNIHHNTAVNDKVFSELGGSSSSRAADNTFAYNLHMSSLPSSRFLVVRGSQSSWGPTRRTRAYNNTVYLSEATSQGVVCSAGCATDILRLKNNIIWAEEKAVYADAPFEEQNNIFWRADGQPFVQFMGFNMHPSDQIAAPWFADPAGGDFRLQPPSPAIDNGTPDGLSLGYTTDMDGNAVPTGGGVDIGAFEATHGSATIALPGRFEAENYRSGGSGVAFQDTTSANIGGAYRSNAVDIQPTQDSSGDYNIGWIVAGEWLAYDVNVANAGSYRFKLRVATPYSGRRLRIELDGNDISGSISLPKTGGWHNWTTLTTAPLSLPEGRHTLRIVAETNSFNLNYIVVD